MTKKKTNVTVHDLARELNLNASSVSRALNDHPRISVETKQRVLKLAKKYNYKLNKAAYTLRTGKGKTIGVIVPRINRFFFSNAIHGIEEIAASHDYNVIICQTLDSTTKEMKSIKALLGDKVDGIVASITPDVEAKNPYAKCCANYKEVVKSQTPLVFFNMVCEDFKVSKVVVDDELGGFMGTKHLIQEGAKRIALLSGQTHLNIYYRRLEGYKRALTRHGYPIEESLILDGDLTEHAGYECTRKLMAMQNPPDAIFAVTDYLAIGGIRFLKRNGYEVPGDVLVCGFMNEPFNDLLQPSLSSIEQHSHQMGQTAAEMLLDEVMRPKKNATAQTVVLTPELMTRHSSSLEKSVLTPG